MTRTVCILSRRSSMVFSAALYLLLPSVATASPHDQTTTATNSDGQQPQVIRSTTRLVQISVVAEDKSGAPLTGLKRENFRLLDGGRPQKIAFFSANAPPNQAAHPPPLPPNVFTNRSDLKGQDPGANIVILFDALNTSFEDQSRARQEVLRFLQSFKPQDHVAIFALTNDLLLLHGFSEDAGALANSVNRFSPQLLAAFDASHPSNFDVPALANDPFFRSFENHVNNANGEIADSRIADRFRITYAALLAIGDYLSSIPGRKSLVWVSGGIPIQIGSEHIGAADRDNFSLANPDVPGAAADMSGLARVLNRANLAIYPVDVHGIDVDDTGSAFFLRQDQRDTFRLLADKTGGKAFYGTNDITGAIRSAFDDGRYTYTLGFYPDHGAWDGKFREIRIRVQAQGAHLRYRRGYFALPEKTERETLARSDLQEVALSTLDAIDLGVTVKAAALPPASDHLLQLQVGVDPRQLLLHNEKNRIQGGLDLVFLQKDSSGKFLAADKQHFDVNFNRREYDALAKSGLILQRRLTIDPGSTEIRVLVRDAGSGSLGSVTLPVGKFL
jgi:VWFA-related protein